MSCSHKYCIYIFYETATSFVTTGTVCCRSFITTIILSRSQKIAQYKNIIPLGDRKYPLICHFAYPSLIPGTPTVNKYFPPCPQHSPSEPFNLCISICIHMYQFTLVYHSHLLDRFLTWDLATANSMTSPHIVPTHRNHEPRLQLRMRLQ